MASPPNTPQGFALSPRRGGTAKGRLAFDQGIPPPSFARSAKVFPGAFP